MLYIITGVLFIFTFVLFLRKAFGEKIALRQEDYDRLKSAHSRLEEESVRLKAANQVLERDTQDTIALFEVTKEICKSLDIDQIFASFKERFLEIVRAQDCVFLKHGADMKDYASYSLMPLVAGTAEIGYLVAKGLSPDDLEKFSILAQQFMLGINRSLLYGKVQEMTITDGLTQAYSRRYFLEKLEEEISRSKKFKLSFSFLMIDIDRFKEINDTYGHLVGDAILREITKTIKENIRQIDFLGRYGGEELSVVLTETDKNEALVVAERIRKAVEVKQISVYDEKLKVTVSIGVSLCPKDALESIALIDHADSALYQAKAAGRNKIQSHS
jgi:diguanylate cyclase (GGDEF)-like protein